MSRVVVRQLAIWRNIRAGGNQVSQSYGISG